MSQPHRDICGRFFLLLVAKAIESGLLEGPTPPHSPVALGPADLHLLIRFAPSMTPPQHRWRYHERYRKSILVAKDFFPAFQSTGRQRQRALELDGRESPRRLDHDD